MELAPTAMNLAPAADGRHWDSVPLTWTAAVAWARAWQPPRSTRPVPVAAALSSAVPSAPSASSRSDQTRDDWMQALAALDAARQQVARDAQPADEADPWPALHATHQLYLARRRVRMLQEALAGEEVAVLWH